jgi:hypothetical protein
LKRRYEHTAAALEVQIRCATLAPVDRPPSERDHSRVWQ